MLKKRKACPQILILIDIMMLLLFVYITQPQAQVNSTIHIEYSDGIITGSQIILKNKQGESIAYFIKNKQFKQTSKIHQLTFNGVKCPKEICQQYIQYPTSYEAAHLYFPNQVMASAYQLFHRYCTKTTCNGNIYINAGTGNSFICAKDGYYKYSLKNKLVKGQQCTY